MPKLFVAPLNHDTTVAHDPDESDGRAAAQLHWLAALGGFKIERLHGFTPAMTHGPPVR
jgi:hypothetical protein